MIRKKEYRINEIYNKYSDLIEFKKFLLILEKILKTPTTKILSEDKIYLTKLQRNKLKKYINRIANEEPIEYILGEAGFRHHLYAVDKNTLIPRIETEKLVENVYNIIKNDRKKLKSKIKILEIGTGTGCISIELAYLLEKNNIDFKIIATDISARAIKIAEKNKKAIFSDNYGKIKFTKANIINKTPIKFDYIISNPPYIPKNKLHKLPKSVKNYEPQLALDGGKEGLRVIKEIITKTKAFRARKTTYFFEFYTASKTAIFKFLEEYQAKNIKFYKDQFNRYRFVSFN